MSIQIENVIAKLRVAEERKWLVFDNITTMK